MTTIEERIATLEADNRTIKANQEDIHDKLDMLISEVSRYKGFWGGLLLMFSAIATAVTLWFKFK